MNSAEFRAELVKVMPGYSWTVHKGITTAQLEATGSQSSGSNRLSTLYVIRRDSDHTKLTYEVKSAGFGLRAPWLHTNKDRTLARALRGLQDHYEAVACTYRAHASALQDGRREIVGAGETAE